MRLCVFVGVGGCVCGCVFGGVCPCEAPQNEDYIIVQHNRLLKKKTDAGKGDSTLLW